MPKAKRVHSTTRQTTSKNPDLRALTLIETLFPPISERFESQTTLPRHISARVSTRWSICLIESHRTESYS
jgi:hypothetical protein